MGTEDPSRKNFPYRPAASPFSSPQSTMPFLSSPPVVGSQGPIGGSNSSSVRPSTTPASQTSPFISSRPAVGPEPSNFRPGPPVRSTTPFMNPSQPSYSQTPAGPFQRAPGQQFPSNTQVPPPRTSPMGQQVSPMPTNHSAASYTSMPALQNPNYQSSAESSYFARPNLQQSSPSMRPYFAPGTQPNAAAQTAPVPSASFLNHQNNYVQPPPVAPTPFISPQHGYAPPPPGATLGPYSMDKIRAPSSTASLGPAQGLAEDFNSLSIGSVPGSFDPGLDSKALPRPLDGDLEPKSYAEMYPLNCNSRYLRLATSAIPNSQSLASRWHLPLGAVVCPLAEAPTGVSNI